MNYKDCITANNVNYSIDKIVTYYCFVLGIDKVKGCQSFMDWLSSQWFIRYNHSMQFAIGRCHDEFNVDCSNGESFYVGIGLLTGGKITYKIKLEYNPNKVGNSYEFITIHNKLLSLGCGVDIKLFDLAIDYPCQRSSFFIAKDKRTYREHSNSPADKTQYLGHKQKSGYCKLYNKQLESSLGYPLTRLELTLSPDISYDKIPFPKVFYVDDLQMCFDNKKLSSLDNYVVRKLLENPTDLQCLDKKAKKKYESLLLQYSRTLTKFDSDLYASILKLLDQYTITIDVNFDFDNPFADGLPVVLETSY